MKVKHHWVHASDDIMNKVLKFCIYCLYGYGFYVVIAELVKRFL